MRVKHCNVEATLLMKQPFGELPVYAYGCPRCSHTGEFCDSETSAMDAFSSSSGSSSNSSSSSNTGSATGTKLSRSVAVAEAHARIKQVYSSLSVSGRDTMTNMMIEFAMAVENRIDWNK